MSMLEAAGLTLLPSIGGFIGSFSTKSQIKTWYSKIDKPKWRPPNWVFAPVWTGLYASMGYASFLIYRDGTGGKKDLALGLYASQLMLNWIWPPIFFNYHKLGLATVEISLMAFNIAACIWAFYPINKNAAYLMVPYLAWVSFASALTYDIWCRNKNKND